MFYLKLIQFELFTLLFLFVYSMDSILKTLQYFVPIELVLIGRVDFKSFCGRCNYHSKIGLNILFIISIDNFSFFLRDYILVIYKKRLRKLNLETKYNIL